MRTRQLAWPPQRHLETTVVAQPVNNQGLSRPPEGSKPRNYKTDALVLRAYAMRDADRLVMALTPQLGKLKLAVRGARRLTSKLGGHLDVLNRVHLAIAIGHTFDVVTGAESVETFSKVKGDLDRLAAALYLMELADLLLPEGAAHTNAYQTLLEALRALEDGRGVAIVVRYTELAMLADAGYMPELHTCLICGREIQPDHHRFAPAMGGIVCDRCEVVTGALIPVTVQGLKVLRHFASRATMEATNLVLNPSLHHELEALLGASVRHVLERELHAAGFIDHLQRLRVQGVPDAPG